MERGDNPSPFSLPRPSNRYGANYLHRLPPLLLKHVHLSCIFLHRIPVQLHLSRQIPLNGEFSCQSSPRRQCNHFRSDGREYELMKKEIRKVVTKGKAAGVLRLVFHDAGTFQIDDNLGGMDGSIVYELDRDKNRPENKGLKSPFKACPFLTLYIDILEKAKSEVDAVNPVSWTDMIAVAGAEAVSICGGPTIQVPLGRLDAKELDPEGKLPEETLDAFGLKQSFQTKGLSTQELVALSGAHTIGNKGFGNPTVFDNTYFKILLDKTIFR
ncbi:hypothetical protein ACFX1Z_043221 [Malus domestica]